MRARSGRRTTTRGRIGSAILATIVASMVLVSVTSTTSSAAPVNTTINASCGARDNDPATVNALNLASNLPGLTNRIGINLNISAANIPEQAGLDEEIDARFQWRASLDQNLIDQGAALINSISVKNLSGTMLVNGPSSVASFPGTAPDTTVNPQVGQAANINLGTFGGPITTTGGGIITYRVGVLNFDSSLVVSGAGNFELKLRCAVQGSNLIARTTVRDPDAPFFDPEVLTLEAAGGQTVTVDLLNDIVNEGKTPLLPESLEIVEPPAAGTASITNGVFSFQAPSEPGTYSTTVQICGAPKPDSGIPGVSEEQDIFFGANWAGWGSGGLSARPVAFSLKVGDDVETPLIWAVNGGQKPLLLEAPTPANWAPASSAGIVGSYALLTTYQTPTAAQVRAALEAVPAIGTGNVEVEALEGDVAGFKVRYINERAEQNMPNLSLGQWYAVPPQEVLDRLLAAATELIPSGDDEGEGGEPSGPFAGIDPELSPVQKANAADAIITAEFNAGRLPSPALWDAYIQFRLIDPILDAVPAILAFITSLFPVKVEAQTAIEGEEPTPPQPLCAQGIIDVTVAEVAGDVDDAGAGGGDGDGPEVGGVTALPGAQPSFVG